MSFGRLALVPIEMVVWPEALVVILAALLLLGKPRIPPSRVAEPAGAAK